jgi:hypothetical protein
MTCLPTGESNCVMFSESLMVTAPQESASVVASVCRQARRGGAPRARQSLAVSLTLKSLPLLAAFVFLFVAASTAQAAVTIESFSAEAASTVAGAHADATTAFALQTLQYQANGVGETAPAGGAPDDIAATLPPGLVADAQNVPKCSRTQYESRENLNPGCPADTQVGVAALHVDVNSGGGLTTLYWGVYNVQPGPGEPALLGIQGVKVDQFSFPLDITASASNHYALTATVPGAPAYPVEVKTLGAKVTVWGVPAAHERGDGESENVEAMPLEGGLEGQIQGAIPPAPSSDWKPFMENPTDCAQTPLTSLSINTYQEPEVFTDALAQSPTPTNCASVPFAPSIKAEPDTTQAGAPAGLDFELTVPQNNEASGQGTSELEKAVVTLPQGMTISPAAASKLLDGCTDEQFGADSDSPAQCPAASVIGEDEVETPPLEGPLKGKVYLGQPLSTDPTSGQMFRVFQELQGVGLDIKVEGSVVANPETGQLTATFANLPELPFQNLRLRLSGGANAVLVNPLTCGPHTTTTELFPYSNPVSRAPAVRPVRFGGHGLESGGCEFAPYGLICSRRRNPAFGEDRSDAARGPARLRVQGRPLRTEPGACRHVWSRKPGRHGHDDRRRWKRPADGWRLRVLGARLERIPIHALGRRACRRGSLQPGRCCRAGLAAGQQQRLDHSCFRSTPVDPRRHTARHSLGCDDARSPWLRGQPHQLRIPESEWHGDVAVRDHGGAVRSILSIRVRQPAVCALVHGVHTGFDFERGRGVVDGPCCSESWRSGHPFGPR